MQRRTFLATFGAAALCASGFASRAAADDGPQPPRVALTFDDGPHPELTPRLLDILERERVFATFYLIGECAARRPDIVARAFAAGHEIGNHSWSHPFLTRLPLAEAGEEIARTDALLFGITGEFPNTLRPPYGDVNAALRRLALPRPLMLWTVDTNDWRTRSTPAVERAAARSGGGIVLMHDIHPTTVDAVPTVIADFKSRGYRFVTVSDYVAWTLTDEAWLDQA